MQKSAFLIFLQTSSVNYATEQLRHSSYTRRAPDGAPTEVRKNAKAQATSFWGDGVPEEIKNAGGKYVDAEVVVDGNLVTSRYPMDLPFFMKELMKLIN